MPHSSMRRCARSRRSTRSTGTHRRCAPICGAAVGRLDAAVVAGPPPSYGYGMRAPREGVSPVVWRVAGEVAFLIAVAVALGLAQPVVVDDPARDGRRASDRLCDRVGRRPRGAVLCAAGAGCARPSGRRSAAHRGHRGARRARVDGLRGSAGTVGCDDDHRCAPAGGGAGRRDARRSPSRNRTRRSPSRSSRPPRRTGCGEADGRDAGGAAATRTGRSRPGPSNRGTFASSRWTAARATIRGSRGSMPRVRRSGRRETSRTKLQRVQGPPGRARAPALPTPLTAQKIGPPAADKSRMRRRIPIGQILIEKNEISEEDLQAALAEQEQLRPPPG